MRKSIWMVRPLPHEIDRLDVFLEEELVAVGYPVGQSFEDCSYNDLRNILKSKGWQEGLRNVNILVLSMNVGDLVLVPSVDKKYVYFAEVTSDYIYEESVDTLDLGYPHQRKVKWLFDKEPLLRATFPEELLGSLRYPGATSDFTKHSAIIEQLINGEVFEQTSEVEEKALKVVEDLLESENEDIRLKAAQILLSLKSNI